MKRGKREKDGKEEEENGGRKESSGEKIKKIRKQDEEAGVRRGKEKK